jgi:glycosyltransferase involved in cell wall biosynthesis
MQLVRPIRGEPALHDAIEAVPDSQRITRLHRVSTDDLIALYQHADAFLMPSLYEGFGLPVAEAMLAGTPVIAAKCASIPEIGGHTITYAEPPTAPVFARCITDVLDWTPAERKQRIEVARAQAATFTWARTANLTYSAFESALETT